MPPPSAACSGAFSGSGGAAAPPLGLVLAPEFVTSWGPDPTGTRPVTFECHTHDAAGRALPLGAPDWGPGPSRPGAAASVCAPSSLSMCGGDSELFYVHATNTCAGHNNGNGTCALWTRAVCRLAVPLNSSSSTAIALPPACNGDGWVHNPIAAEREADLAQDCRSPLLVYNASHAALMCFNHSFSSSSGSGTGAITSVLNTDYGCVDITNNNTTLAHSLLNLPLEDNNNNNNGGDDDLGAHVLALVSYDLMCAQGSPVTSLGSLGCRTPKWVPAGSRPLPCGTDYDCPQSGPPQWNGDACENGCNTHAKGGGVYNWGCGFAGKTSEYLKNCGGCNGCPPPPPLISQGIGFNGCDADTKLCAPRTTFCARDSDCLRMGHVSEAQLRLQENATVRAAGKQLDIMDHRFAWPGALGGALPSKLDANGLVLPLFVSQTNDVGNQDDPLRFDPLGACAADDNGGGGDGGGGDDGNQVASPLDWKCGVADAVLCLQRALTNVAGHAQAPCLAKGSVVPYADYKLSAPQFNTVSNFGAVSYMASPQVTPGATWPSVFESDHFTVRKANQYNQFFQLASQIAWGFTVDGIGPISDSAEWLPDDTGGVSVKQNLFTMPLCARYISGAIGSHTIDEVWKPLDSSRQGDVPEADKTQYFWNFSRADCDNPSVARKAAADASRILDFVQRKQAQGGDSSDASGALKFYMIEFRSTGNTQIPNSYVAMDNIPLVTCGNDGGTNSASSSAPYAGNSLYATASAVLGVYGNQIDVKKDDGTTEVLNPLGDVGGFAPVYSVGCNPSFSSPNWPWKDPQSDQKANAMGCLAAPGVPASATTLPQPLCISSFTSGGQGRPDCVHPWQANEEPYTSPCDANANGDLQYPTGFDNSNRDYYFSQALSSKYGGKSPMDDDQANQDIFESLVVLLYPDTLWRLMRGADCTGSPGNHFCTKVMNVLGGTCADSTYTAANFRMGAGQCRRCGSLGGTAAQLEEAEAVLGPRAANLTGAGEPAPMQAAQFTTARIKVPNDNDNDDNNNNNNDYAYSPQVVSGSGGSTAAGPAAWTPAYAGGTDAMQLLSSSTTRRSLFTPPDLDNRYIGGTGYDRARVSQSQALTFNGCDECTRGADNVDCVYDTSSSSSFNENAVALPLLPWRSTAASRGASGSAEQCRTACADSFNGMGGGGGMASTGDHHLESACVAYVYNASSSNTITTKCRFVLARDAGHLSGVQLHYTCIPGLSNNNEDHHQLALQLLPEKYVQLDVVRAMFSPRPVTATVLQGSAYLRDQTDNAAGRVLRDEYWNFRLNQTDDDPDEFKPFVPAVFISSKPKAPYSTSAMRVYDNFGARAVQQCANATGQPFVGKPFRYSVAFFVPIEQTGTAASTNNTGRLYVDNVEDSATSLLGVSVPVRDSDYCMTWWSKSYTDWRESNSYGYGANVTQSVRGRPAYACVLQGLMVGGQNSPLWIGLNASTAMPQPLHWAPLAVAGELAAALGTPRAPSYEVTVYASASQFPAYGVDSVFVDDPPGRGFAAAWWRGVEAANPPGTQLITAGLSLGSPLAANTVTPAIPGDEDDRSYLVGSVTPALAMADASSRCEQRLGLCDAGLQTTAKDDADTLSLTSSSSSEDDNSEGVNDLCLATRFCSEEEQAQGSELQGPFPSLSASSSVWLRPLSRNEAETLVGADAASAHTYLTVDSARQPIALCVPNASSSSSLSSSFSLPMRFRWKFTYQEDSSAVNNGSSSPTVTVKWAGYPAAINRPRERNYFQEWKHFWRWLTVSPYHAESWQCTSGLAQHNPLGAPPAWMAPNVTLLREDFCGGDDDGDAKSTTMIPVLCWGVVQQEAFLLAALRAFECKPDDGGDKNVPPVCQDLFCLLHITDGNHDFCKQHGSSSTTPPPPPLSITELTGKLGMRLYPVCEPCSGPFYKRDNDNSEECVPAQCSAGDGWFAVPRPECRAAHYNETFSRCCAVNGTSIRALNSDGSFAARSLLGDQPIQAPECVFKAVIKDACDEIDALHPQGGVTLPSNSDDDDDDDLISELVPCAAGTASVQHWDNVTGAYSPHAAVLDVDGEEEEKDQGTRPLPTAPFVGTPCATSLDCGTVSPWQLSRNANQEQIDAATTALGRLGYNQTQARLAVTHYINNRTAETPGAVPYALECVSPARPAEDAGSAGGVFVSGCPGNAPWVRGCQWLTNSNTDNNSSNNNYNPIDLQPVNGSSSSSSLWLDAHCITPCLQNPECAAYRVQYVGSDDMSAAQCLNQYALRSYPDPVYQGQGLVQSCSSSLKCHGLYRKDVLSLMTEKSEATAPSVAVVVAYAPFTDALWNAQLAKPDPAEGSKGAAPMDLANAGAFVGDVVPSRLFAPSDTATTTTTTTEKVVLTRADAWVPSSWSAVTTASATESALVTKCREELPQQQQENTTTVTTYSNCLKQCIDQNNNNSAPQCGGVVVTIPATTAPPRCSLCKHQDGTTAAMFEQTPSNTSASTSHQSYTNYTYAIELRNSANKTQFDALAVPAIGTCQPEKETQQQQQDQIIPTANTNTMMACWPCPEGTFSTPGQSRCRRWSGGDSCRGQSVVSDCSARLVTGAINCTEDNGVLSVGSFLREYYKYDQDDGKPNCTRVPPNKVVVVVATASATNSSPDTLYDCAAGTSTEGTNSAGVAMPAYGQRLCGNDTDCVLFAQEAKMTGSAYVDALKCNGIGSDSRGRALKACGVPLVLEGGLTLAACYPCANFTYRSYYGGSTSTTATVGCLSSFSSSRTNAPLYGGTGCAAGDRPPEAQDPGWWPTPNGIGAVRPVPCSACAGGTWSPGNNLSPQCTGCSSPAASQVLNPLVPPSVCCPFEQLFETSSGGTSGDDDQTLCPSTFGGAKRVWPEVFSTSAMVSTASACYTCTACLVNDGAAQSSFFMGATSATAALNEAAVRFGTTCTACPALGHVNPNEGTNNGDQKYKCVTCPENTFANATYPGRHSAECAACPVDLPTPPGSAFCIGCNSGYVKGSAAAVARTSTHAPQQQQNSSPRPVVRAATTGERLEAELMRHFDDFAGDSSVVDVPFWIQPPELQLSTGCSRAVCPMGFGVSYPVPQFDNSSRSRTLSLASVEFNATTDGSFASFLYASCSRHDQCGEYAPDMLTAAYNESDVERACWLLDDDASSITTRPPTVFANAIAPDSPLYDPTAAKTTRPQLYCDGAHSKCIPCPCRTHSDCGRTATKTNPDLALAFLVAQGDLPFNATCSAGSTLWCDRGRDPNATTTPHGKCKMCNFNHTNAQYEPYTKAEENADLRFVYGNCSTQVDCDPHTSTPDAFGSAGVCDPYDQYYHQQHTNNSNSSNNGTGTTAVQLLAAPRLFCQIEAGTDGYCLPCQGLVDALHVAPFSGWSRCTPCTRGHFNNGSFANCQRCANNSASFDIETHQPNSGASRLSGFTTCVACDTNHTNNHTNGTNGTNHSSSSSSSAKGDASTQCLACSSDSFFNMQTQHCEKCPIGRHTPTQQQSHNHSSNSSSSFSVAGCSVCDAGFVKNNITDECVPCGYGSYADLDATECSGCGRDEETTYFDSDAVREFNSNLANKSNETAVLLKGGAAFRSDACRACHIANEYVPPCPERDPNDASQQGKPCLTKTPRCQGCPHGKWLLNYVAADLPPELRTGPPVKCEACPRDQYLQPSPDAKLTGLEYCAACPSGRATIMNTSTGATKALPWPQQLNPGGIESCVACPSGKHTMRGTDDQEVSQTAASSCQPCAMGRFSNNTGNSNNNKATTITCFLCPVGTSSQRPLDVTLPGLAGMSSDKVKKLVTVTGTVNDINGGNARCYDCVTALPTLGAYFKRIPRGLASSRRRSFGFDQYNQDASFYDNAGDSHPLFSYCTDQIGCETCVGTESDFELFWKALEATNAASPAASDDTYDMTVAVWFCVAAVAASIVAADVCKVHDRFILLRPVLVTLVAAWLLWTVAQGIFFPGMRWWQSVTEALIAVAVSATVLRPWIANQAFGGDDGDEKTQQQPGTATYSIANSAWWWFLWVGLPAAVAGLALLIGLSRVIVWSRVFAYGMAYFLAATLCLLFLSKGGLWSRILGTVLLMVLTLISVVLMAVGFSQRNVTTASDSGDDCELGDWGDLHPQVITAIVLALLFVAWVFYSVYPKDNDDDGDKKNEDAGTFHERFADLFTNNDATTTTTDKKAFPKLMLIACVAVVFMATMGLGTTECLFGQSSSLSEAVVSGDAVNDRLFIAQVVLCVIVLLVFSVAVALAVWWWWRQWRSGAPPTASATVTTTNAHRRPSHRYHQLSGGAGKRRHLVV